MKIIVLGLGQLNFLEYLYGSVKGLDPTIDVTVVDAQGKHELSPHGPFNRMVKSKSSLVAKLQAYLITPFRKDFWRILLFIVFVEWKWRKAMHFVYQWIIEQAYVISMKGFSDFDAVHFHYMQYSYLRKIYFIPRSKSVICSFWGSDLLRTNDTLNHMVVRDALRRADFITVQSIELREIILSKFGRELLPKISTIKFSLNTKVFDVIDHITQATIDQFKTENEIPAGKIIISIGSNANPFNNHVEIVKAIGSVANKKQLFLLVPFNYGIDAARKERYRADIKQALDAAGCDYKFLDKYFGPDELACLRKTVDVMIHMPESDALSGAATEGMYAGTILITGSWLPYSPFSQMGLVFEKLDSFAEIPASLNKIVNNTEAVRNTIHSNREIIKENFSSEATGKHWLELFKSVQGRGK